MGRRKTFRVSFPVPNGATLEEAASYVMEAVQVWRGQLRPEGWDGSTGKADPMWHLDSEEVEVKIGKIYYVDESKLPSEPNKE